MACRKRVLFGAVSADGWGAIYSAAEKKMAVVFGADLFAGPLVSMAFSQHGRYVALAESDAAIGQQDGQQGRGLSHIQPRVHILPLGNVLDDLQLML